MAYQHYDLTTLKTLLMLELRVAQTSLDQTKIQAYDHIFQIVETMITSHQCYDRTYLKILLFRFEAIIYSCRLSPYLPQIAASGLRVCQVIVDQLGGDSLKQLARVSALLH